MTNDSGKKPVGQCGCTNGTCGICVNRMQVTPCANCERLESVNELYHELCHEWNETCSDGCSSWGHQEDCKMVHLAEVKKALQKQVADSRDYALKLEKQLEMCKDALDEIQHITVGGLKMDAADGMEPRDWKYYASECLAKLGEK